MPFAINRLISEMCVTIVYFSMKKCTNIIFSAKQQMFLGHFNDLKQKKSKKVVESGEMWRILCIFAKNNFSLVENEIFR